MAEFCIEAAITAWRDALRRVGIRRDALAELEDHLRTAVDLAIDAGQSPSDAFAAAEADLGTPHALAREFTKENTMHPLSKLIGILFALSTIAACMRLEGGHPIALLALPPLGMILGVTLGGLVASCGLRLVWCAFLVALSGRDHDSGDREALRAVFRRGRRLVYAAGGLQFVLGIMHVLSVLDRPELIGPGFAVALLSLVHAVIIAELGFGSMEGWIGSRQEHAAVAS